MKNALQLSVLGPLWPLCHEFVTDLPDTSEKTSSICWLLITALLKQSFPHIISEHFMFFLYCNTLVKPEALFPSSATKQFS